jgi:two-component system response regulator AdeR
MTKKTVMIVDDDKEFLSELKETLDSSGYDMIAVNDGFTALDIASRVIPDVILVDLKMPKKTGFQLADELRRLSGISDIPIIAMTGFFKDGYGPLMNICGIKRCLKKPFHPLDVITEIEDALIEKQAKLSEKEKLWQI